MLEAALGDLHVAPALDEDVEHDAVLIYNAPKAVRTAPGTDECLAQASFTALPLHIRQYGST